jgi:phosphatidate cytidylyltransferase
LPLVVAVVADTAAYFGGKKFGKHHPFPNISPNKTTEGLVIGVIAGTIVGLA